MTSKTYHIYLKDECLFKDLNESEFDVITDTTKEMANTYEESSY